MSSNQNNSQTAQREQGNRLADAAKANINGAADQSAKMADAARDGLDKMANLGEQAKDTAQQAFQKGVDTASKQAREASDRLTRNLGFSGEEGERLAAQSKRNVDAVSQSGTVLTQAFQTASRSWFELGQKQFQRNLEGLNKLTRTKSVQEFMAVQSELAREGLQHMVQDSRAIAETSLRAFDEASKPFASVAQQSTSRAA